MMSCSDRLAHLKQELENPFFFFWWIMSFIFSLLLLTINCTCQIYLLERKPFAVVAAFRLFLFIMVEHLSLW